MTLIKVYHEVLPVYTEHFHKLFLLFGIYFQSNFFSLTIVMYHNVVGSGLFGW